MFLGIEIGGTKLQLGVGPDDGKLRGLWRGAVDVAAGPEGIRRQIIAAVPELLAKAGIERSQLRGVGIGFGGPVDDITHTVIKSHQIEGWDNYPLADWISDVVGLPAVLGNDADVAGLAEALHGAGKGLSPIFYITIGSGIGGGFIINGEIYRGCGRGAAEFGHLRLLVSDDDRDINETDYAPLEAVASGWAIEQRARQFARRNPDHDLLFVRLAGGQADRVTTQHLGEARNQGDRLAWALIEMPCVYLAEAICHVITLLCPRRIIIGGGVSLLGEKLLFEPLRQIVSARVFKPFAGLTDIVPAALGEEVVIHGAIALARKRLAS
ncbi:MAG TPA: ROK family protein [Gemmataceae bacterium]|nr:ROK family protein [Gemmataceae bacterium]